MASHNIPAQSTPFIGRTHELAAIEALLADPDCRLLSLVGPGGIGKTRLALEAARLETASDGVHFVPLQPLNSSDQLVSAIANALDFQFYPGGEPEQQLFTYLTRKHLLLVLDNFEHLLDGANIVSDLLANAPALRLMVTSRERLNLTSETIYNVSGLHTPNGVTTENALDFSAVKLFVQSTRRVRIQFIPAKTDLPHLARICQLVGGMPLAILLAAAWVEVLSLPEIAAEIECSLDFLETEMRDLPERHRNMRAVFDPTWRRLAQSERDVFKKLSVFRGGFTREAARAITGADKKTLKSLVEKSLVQKVANDRFDIHELLRQYAETRLEEADGAEPAQDAHTTYFADFMDRLWQDVKGRRQVGALRDMDADFDNMRAAWLHMIETRNAEQLRQSANSLWFLCLMRFYHHEAIELFSAATDWLRLETDDLHRRALGCLLSRLTWHYMILEEEETLRQGKIIALEALAILRRLGTSEELILALDSLTMAVAYLNQEDEKKRTAEEELCLAREANYSWGIAHALFFLSEIAIRQKDFDKALLFAEESYQVANRIGDTWLMAVDSGFNLSYLLAYRGNYAEAEQLCLQAQQLFEALDLRWGISMIAQNLSNIALHQGDIEAATAHQNRRLKLAYDIGIAENILGSLTYYAAIFESMRQYEHSLELLSLVAANLLPTSELHKDVETLRARSETQVSREVFAAAWERGKQLDMIATARELLAESGHDVPSGYTQITQPHVEPLTKRQLEVLRLVAEGHSNHQIARELYLVVGTVKGYIHETFSKLRVTSRTQAVARARELNLIP